MMDAAAAAAAAYPSVDYMSRNLIRSSSLLHRVVRTHQLLGKSSSSLTCPIL